jgi:hypothetical protein
MVPDGPCFFHLATASPNLASRCRPPVSVSPPPSPGLALAGTGPGLSSHFITAYTKTSFFWWAACAVLYCASSSRPRFARAITSSSPSIFFPCSSSSQRRDRRRPSRSRSGDSHALYQSPASTADLTKSSSNLGESRVRSSRAPINVWPHDLCTSLHLRGTFASRPLPSQPYPISHYPIAHRSASSKAFVRLQSLIVLLSSAHC